MIKRNPQRQGIVAEKAAAKRYNTKPHAGSGASEHVKSDFSTEEYQFEYKHTEKKSYSLKHELLHKIEKEANAVDKTPVFCVEYQTQMGNVTSRYVVLREVDFKRLMGRQDEN